ncbi:MAG TPA: hypothetical protein VER96_11495 [Polyangiaceae bacterium]|nr:hypothetical protein [Polyangiaceae bacterium]
MDASQAGSATDSSGASGMSVAGTTFTLAGGGSGGSELSSAGGSGGLHSASAGSSGRAGTSGGSGGNDPGAAGASGSVAVGGRSGETPNTIFSSADMPHCEWNGDAQHQIHGTLNGQAVDIRASAMAEDLIGSRFRTYVLDPLYVYPLTLTWSVQPRLDYAIPLSGGTLLMRESQPFSGQSFCITAGEFGSRSVQAQDNARENLFHITGARAGDCTGPEVPVELFGCILSSDTYFPDRLNVDFPVDPSRPNIDSGKAILDLTDDERAELCDWNALMLGGYGQTIDCRAIGGTTHITFADRAQCLAVGFAHTCRSVTVSDYVQCIVAQAPTHSCTYPSDACAAMNRYCN